MNKLIVIGATAIGVVALASTGIAVNAATLSASQQSSIGGGVTSSPTPSDSAEPGDDNLPRHSGLDEDRPGNGFGDDNHHHTGAPGHEAGDDNPGEHTGENSGEGHSGDDNPGTSHSDSGTGSSHSGGSDDSGHGGGDDDSSGHGGGHGSDD